ncbi:MAG: PASTA domain-containing protein [Coriobacteriia bacterium]|nr:PASTA domain-containing protein [Coriobacteriia bacterium]
MQTDLTLAELLQLPPIERERPYPTVGLSSRTKILISALAFLSVALIIAAGTYFYVTRPVVPDVIGLTEAKARLIARDAGLDLSVSATMYSVAPAHSIIGQAPEPGGRPFLHRTMRVVLSSGKQTITVPLLEGETEVRARSVLEQLGLNAQVVYEYAPDQIGKVLSTKPEAYAAVNTGDIVVLRVGAPRSPIALVEYDLQGKTIVINATDEWGGPNIANDIAIRLSSLLRAAQATVLMQEEVTEETSAYIWLVTDEHDTGVIGVMNTMASVEELEEGSLSAAVIELLAAVPLSTTYEQKEDGLALAPLYKVTVSFGTEGDMALYQDTRWKDNIARSLYLALGQTLVR